MAELFPLWWANAFTIALFVAIAVGCWLVKPEAIFGDAPDQARWRDLRVWATALICIQVFIYYIFS